MKKSIVLNENQKILRKRLIEILYNLKSSHIGSCFNTIDLIDSVYSIKNKNDKFILSCGHAALAFYVVLEKYKFLKNTDLKSLYLHPDRNKKIGIEVSSGSLGLGLPISVGMAIANRENKIYCLISDGECAEGSIWESFRIIQDLKIKNIRIIITANGWGAYGPISLENLKKRIEGFGFKILEIDGHNKEEINNSLKVISEMDILFARTNSEQLPFLKGLDAHYYIMNERDYQVAMDILK